MANKEIAMIITNEEIETKNLEKIEEFECNICYQYMHPPIFACTNGHKLCFNCLWLLNTCGMCRVELDTMKRSRDMEAKHADLSFPCENSDSGCKQWIPGSEVDDHIAVCMYGLPQKPCTDEEEDDKMAKEITRQDLLRETSDVWNRAGDTDEEWDYDEWDEGLEDDPIATENRLIHHAMILEMMTYEIW